MGRRSKQPDLVHNLHHVFLHVPTWWCLPAAALAYAGVQLVLSLAASSNPVYRGLLPSASLFGYLPAGVVLVAGLTGAFKKAERRNLYDQQRSLESIRALGWREFEQLTGEAYRRQGYRVTENGGGGADGGIDLIRGHRHRHTARRSGCAPAAPYPPAVQLPLESTRHATGTRTQNLRGGLAAGRTHLLCRERLLGGRVLLRWARRCALPP